MDPIQSPRQFLICQSCRHEYSIDDVRYSCDCGGLIDVSRQIPQDIKRWKDVFDSRIGSNCPEDRSGVWRFREGVLDLEGRSPVSHPEGRTNLYHRSNLSDWAGLQALHLKHEGENPTGSFKDRGMTVAISQAKKLGRTIAACASTGNTSASLAAYAAQASMKAVVFIPAKKITASKLAQAVGYGATCLAIKGDFDVAMNLVQAAAKELGIYMVNSLNPFRIEGQKTIIWELFQDLDWNAPDWIVVPGGNLGNTSAFGKAIDEAYAAGWIKHRPRLATIQAEGANPFFQSYQTQFKDRFRVQAQTHATAIQIGNPVNHDRAVRAIRLTRGVVSQVSEQEIRDAKKIIDLSGIGCEPASACSLAGIRSLVREGIIGKRESAVAILTGHMLKDTDAILGQCKELPIIETDPSIEAIGKIIAGV